MSAEYTLLARLLTAPEAITTQSIAALQAITRTKIWTLGLAVIQAGLLFVAAMIWPR